VTGKQRMRLGLMLPIGAGALGEGRPVRWADLREMARTAESVGIDTLFLPDHLLFRKSPPGNLMQVNMAEGKVRGIWEAWTILSALAEATQRVHLGPLVACTGFRNPAILAKMADTLDEVSDGRLVLGLGAGWHEPEYDAFGIPYDHRVGRFEEALAVIVPLLREGRVDFQGQYYQARDCVLAPRGPRSAGPPILIGAQRPRMLALAARYADLYDADYHLAASDVKTQFEAFDRACAEAQRNPATVTHAAGTRVALVRAGEPRPGLPGVTAPHGAAVFELGGMRQMARVGTTDELLAHVRTFEAIGVQHLTLSLVHPPGPKGIEMLAPVVESLRG
jgi:alkanesulfonate monooxygenase SsuD/methylene tetrahydromethanopterin reductase-like flavin-dependent oxidoreductase (luciferase family)